MKEKDLFRKIVEDCPVIAAVKDMDGLEKACNPIYRSYSFYLATSAPLWILWTELKRPAVWQWFILIWWRA